MSGLAGESEMASTVAPPVSTEGVGCCGSRGAMADRIVALASLAAVGVVSYHFLTAPISVGAARVTDDAFYYFKIAQNICSGNGVSFDGISSTNGFHPLWMVVLLPIYRIWTDEPIAALRVVQVVCACMLGLTGWMTFRLVRRRFGLYAGLVALGLSLSTLNVNLFVNGLETGLMVLIVWSLLDRSHANALLSPHTRWRGNVQLGILIGLLFLSRLDTAFVVIAVFAAIVVNCLRVPSDGLRCLARKAWQVGGVSAVFALAYFSWNWLSFGHLTPISGALKSSFPYPSLRASSFEGGVCSMFLAALGVAVVAVVVALVARRSRFASEVYAREGASTSVTMFVPLVGGAVLHQVYSSVFMHWAVHWWHFALYLPLFIYACAWVVGFMQSVRPIGWVVRALGIPAVIVFVFLSWRLDARSRADHHVAWFEAAAWASSNLPEDAVVAIRDAGLFGYMSGRRTINLDGVVNSYAFQDVLRDQQLAKYFEETGVTHLADYQTRYDAQDRYRFRVPSHLHRDGGMFVEVGRQGAVYESKPYRPGRYKSSDRYSFSIWRYADASLQPADLELTARGRGKPFDDQRADDLRAPRCR